MNRTLLAFAFALIGCSSSGKSNNDGGLSLSYDDMAALTYHYVANTILIPTAYSQYAADLNNDGSMENEFGTIVNLLKTQMIDPQASENSAIMKGEQLNLFSFHAGDLMNDDGATATAFLAQTVNPPDFGGSGMFPVDASTPAAPFTGKLSGGMYLSDDPYSISNPPTVWVRIGLAPGVAVNMPCKGARVRFQPTRGALMNGQLNGGFKKTDVDAILVPGLRQALDNIAHTMPCDANCMNVLNTFDTNSDGMITLDEVATNPLTINILKPDVQLFDANGNWKPVSPATMKDSISFGVGFSAVSGVFSEP